MTHFYRNEDSILPTEIFANQEKLFWNKLLKCKYAISGFPNIFLICLGDDGLGLCLASSTISD